MIHGQFARSARSTSAAPSGSSARIASHTGSVTVAWSSTPSGYPLAMVDRAVPNLPSRDFAATVDFYVAFGFVETFHDVSC